jgi:hypothetical protein
MTDAKTLQRPLKVADKKSKPISKAKSNHGGPRPNSGGARPGSGRPAGARNKVTLELQEAAQVYTEDALETLHRICTKGESESARVTAACALLDRGHGKPRQQVELGSDPNKPLHVHSHGVRWMTEEEAKARGWA